MPRRTWKPSYQNSKPVKIAELEIRVRDGTPEALERIERLNRLLAKPLNGEASLDPLLGPLRSIQAEIRHDSRRKGGEA